MEGLYLGEDLLGKIPASALVIECSTIAPDSARKVAQAAEARGIAMIDAPVSGGTGGAAAGTLTSSSAACPPRWSAPVRCWKRWARISSTLAPRAGQVAKICNNMLLGILMAGTSEALALGVANGLDPKVLSDIIAKTRAATGPPNSTTPGPA